MFLFWSFLSNLHVNNTSLFLYASLRSWCGDGGAKEGRWSSFGARFGSAAFFCYLCVDFLFSLVLSCLVFWVFVVHVRKAKTQAAVCIVVLYL